MTYKQIETSREIRLWVVQIVTPIAIGVGIALSNPTVRNKIASAVDDVRWKLKKAKLKSTK